MTDACPFAGHERQKSEILSQTSNVQVNQTLPYPKLRPLLFWDLHCVERIELTENCPRTAAELLSHLSKF